MAKDKKVADKVKPLDEPYNSYSGLSKRQMLNFMKKLQKIKKVKEFRMGGKVDISNYKGQF